MALRAEYRWLPDPGDPAGELTETLVLSRAYAIAMPASARHRPVGVTEMQLSRLLDSRREIDEQKMMAFADKAANVLYGAGNWTRDERSEIVAKLVNAYWHLIKLPCGEMPPEPTLDELAERARLVVKIDGKTVVDAR